MLRFEGYRGIDWAELCNWRVNLSGKSLPVDYLKIDGAFVKGIVNDEVDLAMVRSINDVAKIMGKRTIAEFVENDAILEKLREIGVDCAQGYGISRPAPILETALSYTSGR